MTLARQTTLLAWLAALTLTVVLGATGMALREVREQTRQSEMAEATAQGINQLRFLVMETALYSEPRSALQWRLRMDSFTRALAAQRYSSLRENTLLARERDNLALLARQYQRLESAPAIARRAGGSAGAELTANTVSMLFLTSQDMIDDASELLRQNRLDLRAAQNRASWIVLGSVLLLAGMIVACIVIVRRRVLRPVAALQAVTEQVARGELGLRLHLAEVNEIGQLAGSFDRMTAQLEESRAQMLAENSERRSAQQALERSMASLVENSAALARARSDIQTIIDHTPALVAYWDSDLRNVFANRTYEAWFGVAPRQIAGMHLREVIGAQRYAELEPRLQSVMAGNPELFENAVRFDDGTVRELLFSYVPDLADGKVRGCYGFISDISQLRSAQAGQARALARLEGVVDAAIDFAIIATGLDGTVELFSRGAERLLGYRATEVVGHANLARFHRVDEVAAVGRELSERFGRPVAGFDVFVEGARHGQSETREWTYVRRDGQQVEVSLAVTALSDARGQPIGFLGVATDIGKDKAILRTLAAARDEAEAGSRAKTEFLANVSHEIRTPMNAILGLLRMLQQSGLTETQRGYADNTHTAARSLLRLLNDILDFSKIDTGNMHLESAPFSLRGLAEELRALGDSLAAGKQLALHLALDPALPATVMGDPLRLRQVLLNLLGNAIKFTPRGEVRIELAMKDGRVEFAVQDSGIGMAPGQMAGIFDAFSQAETSTSRRFGGTGLGLAISQRLVQLMGGALEVSSVEGAGSRFWFALALAPAQAPLAPAPPVPAGAPRLGGVRLLVVDDNELNRQVADSLLCAEGARVLLADSGAQALALLERDPRSVDLVLMDVQMPGMDGHAATRAIRASAALRQLPVIAMTANAMAGDREACLAAGMDDYIQKPIDIEVLVEVVVRYRHEGRAVPRPPEPVAGGAARALQRLGGNAQLFLSVARNYPGDARLQAKSLDEALADARWGDAAKQCHSLRGVAGTVGADALTAHLAALEAALRANPALLAVASERAALVPHIERSIEALAQACASLEARRVILVS